MTTPRMFGRVAELALTAGLLFTTMQDLDAQPAGYNYDEAKVPAYTLPDALKCDDGRRVADAAEWKTKRRPELLRIFADQVYGKTPTAAVHAKESGLESGSAFGGTAVRKQFRLEFERNGLRRHVDVLMYLPAGTRGPVSSFIGLNVHGNHTIHGDPAIRMPETWAENKPAFGLTNNRATDRMRGSEASMWQVEKVVGRGYGLVVAYCGDLFPDRADGAADSVIALFQREQAPGDWNAIGAWAWGLSRMVDHLATGKDVDVKRLALVGHSRLGKTALWAGAQDERFGIVISNNSGEGGAALARRCFGETTRRINTSFPHWFSGNFKKYNDREAEMPVDQHELLALMAPRPVYVASASEDLWADPKGEFLSAKAAGEVYAMFGTKGVGVGAQPPVDTPVGGDVGYHLRTGKHDMTAYDWDRYLDFADQHFAR